MEYLLLAISWFLYLFTHSLLAAGRVKDYVKDNWPLIYSKYRFVYSLISSFGLFIMVYLMAITKSELLFESTSYLKYVAMVLSSLGIILIVKSFRFLSIKLFLGLNSSESSDLITDGIHEHIRHPIYSGTILILIGMITYHPTITILVSSLSIFLYLPFGIAWEEQRLVEEFGIDYLNYKELVPAVFPRLWR